MYDEFIVPNNATLALVGDVKVDESDPSPRGTSDGSRAQLEPPARMDVEAEPPPGGSLRLDWLEPLEPQVIVRYRIPGIGHPDRPAFDVDSRGCCAAPRACWLRRRQRREAPVTGRQARLKTARRPF